MPRSAVFGASGGGLDATGSRTTRRRRRVVAPKTESRFGAPGKPTICVHIDTFNGQVAFVRLDQIEENDINWITRQQMEGQTVFNIDQGFFAWRIMDKPPSFDTLDLNL